MQKLSPHGLQTLALQLLELGKGLMLRGVGKKSTLWGSTHSRFIV